MFIQVIRGKVSDPAAARAAMDAWQRDLKPNAEGYLGSTGGVAADGTCIVLARFASHEAARANSDRPEQGAWWEQKMSKVFASPPEFFDCPEVLVFLDGGSDDAGFVQVMSYTTRDRDALRRLVGETGRLAAVRPEIIGGVTAIAADDTTFDVAYFTSEAEAREGERKELPPDLRELQAEQGRVAEGVEYIDLTEPWFDSA